MKKILLIAFIGIFTSCNSQQKATAVKDQSGNLIGIADKESFNQAPFKAWLIRNLKHILQIQLPFPL